MRNLILLVFIPLLMLCSQKEKTIQVLILSGSNNHDWEQTTQQLEKIFSQSDRFRYKVTFRPDTLTSGSLESYDVVLSNWNSWPKNEVRWPEKTEKALSEFIKGGGGFVTFHASTSVFYEWPEFDNFTTASWIDSTRHGKNSVTKVVFEDTNHPITKGLTDFYVFDELWINAKKNKKFNVLATATNSELEEKGTLNQPAVMVATFGKGRVFHTILGHDARAMRNTGFQMLLLRGSEWAATGKVTQPVAQELQPVKETINYNWLETDTTFALLNGEQIIWQYNFNTKYGRPFFHPVFVGRNNITCVSPDDHPWHLGQWFCWKYINGVNYWEYKKNTFQSEGITDLQNIEIKKNSDYSAEIHLDINYHPNKEKTVLNETRTVKISTPGEDGKIWMDYDLKFEAVANIVELNRTPILGQEHGTSWGGYAGLSVRFNQDFMNSEFITPWHDNDSINGRQGDWLYMGFTGIDGQQIGSQIMADPQSQRVGSAWYSVNTEEAPFYYFSPAYLYFSPVTLKKGDCFSLNYRILHLTGEADANTLNREYKKYLNQ